MCIKNLTNSLQKYRLMIISQWIFFYLEVLLNLCFELHNGPKKLVKSNKSISRNFVFDQIHFLQFQKWPKTNFWTGKKFKIAKNVISRKFFFKNLIFSLWGTQQARKLKKSRQKKKSWNCISGNVKLSWPFLKLQKMDFGQKYFRGIDLIDFTNFLGQDLLKFSLEVLWRNGF